jgi:hypothetical protein
MTIEIITLDSKNIATEHLCCAMVDKKCQKGVILKKQLIKKRLPEGFTFKKCNVQGKVLIEYVPAENAWSPIDAPGYMFIHCFWVSGRYKGQGLGTKLLKECIKDAKNKKGIVVVTSQKPKPFLTDKGFFIKKGFEICDEAPPYFELMVKKFKDAPSPKFRDNAKKGKVTNKKGLTFIYSDLCPFTDSWVDQMIEFSKPFNIPSKKIKIKTKKEAQNIPSAFPIFSVFYNGNFLTHQMVGQKRFHTLLNQVIKK